jgi:predicted transcriptional regulator
LSKETSSLFLLSLDELIANRPHLLPSVDIEGYSQPHREELWWQQYVSLLPVVLPKLTVERQALINALFFRGLSLRAYARETDRAYTSVHEQLQRTLKTLRKLLEQEIETAHGQETAQP